VVLKKVVTLGRYCHVSRPFPYCCFLETKRATRLSTSFFAHLARF
jgi:hypothetical protein